MTIQQRIRRVRFCTLPSGGSRAVDSAIASLRLLSLSRSVLLAGLVTAAAGLLITAAPAVSAAAAAGPGGDGWIQLAHLSPNTPPVDVYLYSFGDPKAMLVLKHVAYGTVSPFEKLASGEYTVAMRGAGAKPGSPPVLSTNVTITPGGAYTVAGLGPASGLRLQVLRDRLTTPKGESLVRVIQASLRDHRVTVTAGPQVLARQLAFGNVTNFATARPGTWMVHVSGAAGMATKSVALKAGSIHTLVVLDGAGGSLMIDNLVDAAGSGIAPQGGAATGLGGTAPVPAPSPAPWAAVIAAGALCAMAAAYWLRRVRHQARHAR
jgi:Domain of unknown function (DUF4397)